MSINVQLPNLVPMNLAPTTESARRDNQIRDVIPPPKANQATKSDNTVPNERNPGRNIVKDSQFSLYSQELAGTAEAEADKNQRVNGDEERRQNQQEGKQQRESSSQQQDTNEHESQAKQQQVEQQLRALEQRHQEVVTHERAHQTAGGQYAGAASLDYQRGPDGKSYAVGGEVSIDISKVPGDPQATISKMQQVRRAALAPASPSGQDRAVAAMSSRIEQGARVELQAELTQKSANMVNEPASALAEPESDTIPSFTAAVPSSQEAAPPAPQADKNHVGATKQTLATEFVSDAKGLFSTTAKPEAALPFESQSLQRRYYAETEFGQTAISGADAAKAQEGVAGISAAELKQSAISDEMLLRSNVIDRRYNLSHQTKAPAGMSITA